MKFIFMCLVLVLFASCGARKLAIKNADTLIAYQMQKRLPLNSSQKDELSKDIDQFLNAHKAEAKTLIPLVDELDVAKPVDEIYGKVESFYLKISADFTRVISHTMAKLNKAQQVEFFEDLKDDNVRLAKKEKDHLTKVHQDRVKMILGSITEDQEKILDSYKPYFAERVEMRSKKRFALEAQMAEIFKNKKNLEDELNTAFLDYQKEGAENSKNLEIIKKFVPTLTDPQKKVLKENIEQVREMIMLFISTGY